jgi:hypothetical protein
LRRFFLHVLPKGFVRIRHFGFFAHRRRAALLPMCFTLLRQTGDSQTVTDSTPKDAPRPLWLCPQCGGTMAIVERFTASEARLRAPPERKANDHDLLFLISNLSRAGTPAREDRSHPVPSHRHASRNSPTAPLCPPDASFIAYFVVSRHQQHHSKHIAPQCQTGSLQVALSKTLRQSRFVPLLEADFAGAFPIQPLDFSAGSFQVSRHQCTTRALRSRAKSDA